MTRMGEKKIVLWGPPNSGKTAFVGQLFARGQDGSRYAESEWRVAPTSAATEFFERALEKMVEKNEFLLHTARSTAQDIGFDLVHLPTNRQVTFLMHDRAGEDYLAQTNEIVDSLTAADALILLFDYRDGSQRLIKEIVQTLNRIRSRGEAVQRDPRPIAFCLSKVDLDIHSADDLRRVRQEPDLFVTDHCGQLVEQVKPFCDRYRLFPVSASGVRRQFGTVDPSSMYDDFLRHRFISGGMPINLFEPFNWIFAEFYGAS